MNISDFDELILFHILSFLSPIEISFFQSSSKFFYLIIFNFWKYYLQNFNCLKHLTYRSFPLLTHKELALFSWKAFKNQSGIFLQIGGLTTSIQIENIFSFSIRSNNNNNNNNLNNTTTQNNSTSQSNYHNPNSINNNNDTHQLNNTDLIYLDSSYIFNEVQYPIVNQELCAPAFTIDSFGRPIIFGGWLREEGTSTSNCYYFTSNNGWELFYNLSQPNCFASSSRNISGDILLCGGGESPWQGAEVYTATKLLKFQHSDSNSCVVNSTSLSSLLSPRCGHGTVTPYDGHTYAIGGYGGGNIYYSSGEFYDYEKNQWYSIPSMSEQRSGAGFDMGWDGGIYCVGGSSNGYFGSNTIERYDTRCKTWEILGGQLKHQRGYTSACFDGTGMILYISGGLVHPNVVRSIEYYDIRMNAGDFVQHSSSYAINKFARYNSRMNFMIPQIMNCSMMKLNNVQSNVIV